MSRIKPQISLAVALIMLSYAAADESAQRAATVCPQAHAHNDYLHERPLIDALEQGFCSVEADIFLIDGELLVAHTRRELSPDRTLENLYLEPLRERISTHNGSVHGDGQPFTLLIDIKSQGEDTYRALAKTLAQYKEIFTAVTDGTVEPKPVTAVVSGNRPFDAIEADSPRYVGIDGRLSDLASDRPPHLMPLISDRWGSHFRWRGRGAMKPGEKEKLERIVRQAHEKNRRVRFWAIPDNPTAWAALQSAGVDLINTDNLAGLSEFLTSTTPQPE